MSIEILEKLWIRQNNWKNNTKYTDLKIYQIPYIDVNIEFE